MKKFVAGLIVGLIIGTCGFTFAASETVQATFAKFNFIVNGEPKTLEADPLVYQGTTYLPVRVVSNMLGYDVTYRADSRTIELVTAGSEETSGSSPEPTKPMPGNNITLDVTIYVQGEHLPDTYHGEKFNNIIIENDIVYLQLRALNEAVLRLYDKPLRFGGANNVTLDNKPIDMSDSIEREYRTFISLESMATQGILEYHLSDKVLNINRL